MVAPNRLERTKEPLPASVAAGKVDKIRPGVVMKSEARLWPLLEGLTAETLQILAANSADRELAMAAEMKLLDGPVPPPVPEYENFERAARVAGVIDAYARLCRIGEDELQSQISDLISDLLHHAEFDACRRRSATDTFTVAKHGVGLFAEELVCPDGLGPDMAVAISINGLEPRQAIAIAQADTDY